MGVYGIPHSQTNPSWRLEFTHEISSATLASFVSGHECLKHLLMTSTNLKPDCRWQGFLYSRGDLVSDPWSGYSAIKKHNNFRDVNIIARATYCSTWEEANMAMGNILRSMKGKPI